MDQREADSFEPASLLRGNREIQGFLRKKVIPSGFEPETHSLEGCCSIQLSYQTIKSGAKVNKNWEIAKFYTLNLM